MIAILLLLMAAAPAQPAARATAVATARILPGVRIDLEKQQTFGASADAGQRSRLLRSNAQGLPPGELRLIEFQ